MARYDLPDEAWTLIQPLLPAEPATPQAGRPWAEHRMIINGMFWVLCSGAPWRDLPERYGPWKTVYNRFNRWSKSGVINIIFNKLLWLLTLMASSTGQRPRWMAVISGRSNVPLVRKTSRYHRR
jgi:putative transposase